MLSTRERSIQPGLGPVPGAAERHVEHKKGHISLLEMPVLQPGASLALSFIPHVLTAGTTRRHKICALLFTRPARYRSGFKGFSCRKLTFETFLMP